MRTKDLPLSDNVDDRRGEAPTLKPRLTLAEQLALGEKAGFAAEPESPLAKSAGVDDIKPREG